MNDEHKHSRIKEQLKAIDRANKLLHSGKLRLYRQALQDIIPSFLPDHPLRFTVLLKRPSRKSVQGIIKSGRKIDGELDLNVTIDGSISHEEYVLGVMNKEDREILEGIGEDLLSLYTLNIIELKHDEDKQAIAYIAVELARPELWINSQGILCAGEAGTGYKKQSSSGQVVEPSAVQIARAIEEDIQRREGGGPKYARGSGN